MDQAGGVRVAALGSFDIAVENARGIVFAGRRRGSRQGAHRGRPRALEEAFSKGVARFAGCGDRNGRGRRGGGAELYSAAQLLESLRRESCAIYGLEYGYD